MFGNTPPKTLVHLSRSQQPSPSDRLPEGECRFIFPEAEPDGSRQRCTCVSFVLNKDVPGSLCGCNHQAWHHLRQCSSRNNDSVPLEEYHKLFDHVQRVEDTVRRVQDELSRERRQREKADNELVHMLRGTYNNMAFLRYYVDEKLETLRLHCEDKTEGVLDRAHGASEEVEKLKARLADIDETLIRLEERIDTARWSSRSLTPMPETTMETTPAPAAPVPQIPAILPIRSEDKHPEAWDVRVILVPSKNQAKAYDINSLAYKRCQSRGLQQDMHILDRSAAQFVQCVEAGFATILRNRLWVPLMCLRSSDMSITQLPRIQWDYTHWDYQFLESQCMAHDKAQGDIIFIALQDAYLSWEDIRNLPRVFGSDESCWNHDPELDGRLPTMEPKPELSQMDFKMTLPSRAAGDLRVDSDSVYDYSPPPYTTGSQAAMDRLPSALGVLAGAATYIADTGSRPVTAPSSSMTSPRTPMASPGASMLSLNIEEDDEHRTKRTKRGALRPEPQPTPTGLAPITSSPPPAQPAYYYSGRSRRRIQTGKTREPLDWRVSEIKIGNPAKGLFHRHDKGKAAEQSQAQAQAHALQQQQQQQQQQQGQQSDQGSRA